ncbi:MAG: 1-(5-phosphoribosyl)-5-[(5-phosphoribosylamino)methylideneamino]imidazole-4-carboxamide isomerase [Spirochaetales bacterium]|jgi:phosphoribosylformimino-5-aminoimidazole carboxamide ribotide isomerase|nr:1-(5-phosphoribosyl)-5-[(5-phosphoribosylamino)methylideneamino]imidazole-4-carboxamide isomerase [Spirochaetales bacterium]
MFEVIPAIDVIEGNCVRLTRGDYEKKSVYSSDPLDVAMQYEDAGLRRLHLVDLDGAKSGGLVNRKVLERIASHTSLVIDFGGGIKRDEDIQAAFDSGASMVTGGSVAVKNPELFLKWLALYGSEKLILGADLSNGFVAVSGWLEHSHVTGVELVLRYLEQGIRKVISTEISRDGMLSGPSYDLYKQISDAAQLAGYPDLQLTASGGVSSVDDLVELKKRGLSGVIVGKALYEGKITVEELASLQEYAGAE